MAAAAIAELSGVRPAACLDAAAIALKNVLGLVCDPVAGLVECPCIKRNAAGAAGALAAAEMALAGVQSRVPWDEVILAMYQIGLAMPHTVKETALGGLANSETGKAWKKKLWQKAGDEQA
jgi:L-serine dehydratase